MVVIESLLPNPVGPDRGAEWIELTNRGTDAVNLSGWSLKDASGKVFVLSGTLAPQGGIKLQDPQTKITLNNDTDTIYLYDRSGGLIDKLSYENPAEGEIVARGGAVASATSATPVNIAANSSRIIPQTNLESTPIFVGLLLAIIMGALAAYVAKYLSEKDG